MRTPYKRLVYYTPIESRSKTAIALLLQMAGSLMLAQRCGGAGGVGWLLRPERSAGRWCELKPCGTIASVAALLVFAVAGCTDGDGPVFNSEGGRDVPCMAHQPEPPGSRYTDPERHNTAELLTVLRYYTAHGRKPYCDGAGATEADRAWAELYVRQGANRENVASLLAD